MSNLGIKRLKKEVLEPRKKGANKLSLLCWFGFGTENSGFWMDILCGLILSENVI
jgi:hypothetical protein